MTEDRESWAPRLDNKETLSTTEFDTSRNRDGILVGIRWFEFPLLFYFMVHFFPPMPATLAEVVASACRSHARLEELGVRGRELVRDLMWRRRAQDFLALARDAVASHSGSLAS